MSPHMLVHVIGQRGIEDSVHASVQQRRRYARASASPDSTPCPRGWNTVPLHTVCRLERPVSCTLKAQRRKQRMPQGRQLVHAQGQRQADGASRRCPRRGFARGQLVAAYMRVDSAASSAARLLPSALVALVAGNEFLRPTENVLTVRWQWLVQPLADRWHWPCG